MSQALCLTAFGIAAGLSHLTSPSRLMEMSDSNWTHLRHLFLVFLSSPVRPTIVVVLFFFFISLTNSPCSTQNNSLQTPAASRPSPCWLTWNFTLVFRVFLWLTSDFLGLCSNSKVPLQTRCWTGLSDVTLPVTLSPLALLYLLYFSMINWDQRLVYVETMQMKRCSFKQES